MALLQKTVLSGYLDRLDKEKLDTLYHHFIVYYHNDEVQSNIRNLTEIQFQSEFLSRLFVDTLGYTLNPAPNYNLSTEYKNPKDAKKADGAVIIGDKVPMVIELKGTDTTDLNQIENQAFGYKNNQPSCHYIVTSNFEKLRFYIDNAIEYIEFNLFKLTKSDFYLLYLCLSFESIAADKPKQIKQESIAQESQVSHLLYKDYASFKSALYADLTANNPTIEPLVLFEKSQKLLDRFLFIFFAEDKGLLPPNFIRYIINNWKKTTDLDIEQSLYQRFKMNFNYLNQGHTNKDRTIFAYNGGLFAPDSILDALIIDDELLRRHSKKLSDYDFNSEVDVNILGHIFENSLTEIDEVKAQLSGNPIDKNQTKRKKDGVFYTPKYITKYIVQNTLGKLCEDKKADLAITVTVTDENGNPTTIDNPEYTHKKGRRKATVKALYATLMTYQQWLLDLTICDPACGSGAFLNETLNFLIKEHHYINELELKLTGTSLPLPNIENAILENNIYGVDINAESVDIAKLALWLRTAKKNRKLNDLNNHLKCGNSLIDDPQIAGELAFDWQKAFPHVFANGGFDVVIGNPPYVRAELLPAEHGKYYQQAYQVYDGAGDLFSYFYELGLKIMKPNGLFGFISNTFDKTTAGKTLRRYLAENKRIIHYLDFTEVQIFKGATTYPVVMILNNRFSLDNSFVYQKVPKTMQDNVQIELISPVTVSQSMLDSQAWSFNDVALVKVLQRLKTLPTIKKRYGKCFRGIVTGYNDAFIIDETTKKYLIDKDESASEVIQRVVEGKDTAKWKTPLLDKYLLTLYPAKNLNIKNYPSVEAYLLNFGKKRLEQIGGSGSRKKTNNHWFETQDSIGYWQELAKPKIIWANLQNSNKFSYDDSGLAINAPACFLPTDDKALLCILNSKLIWQFLLSICVVRSGGYIEVKPQYFEQIPIAEMSNIQHFQLTEKAEQMLTLNADLQAISSRFLRLLAREFNIIKPNTKLQSWYKLDDKTFFIELEKDRRKAFRAATGSTKGFEKLNYDEQEKLADYFLDRKQKAQTLQKQINSTDKAIDNMVYELYGLNAEEITIIEANT